MSAQYSLQDHHTQTSHTLHTITLVEEVQHEETVVIQCYVQLSLNIKIEE